MTLALAFQQSVVDWRLKALDDAMLRFARIAITGPPRVGKTWLAAQCTDRIVVHTDEWKDKDWPAQPQLIIAGCDGLDRFLLEGVQVPRALRKGLKVDCLLWLDLAGAEQTPQQKAMGKAIATILNGIRAQLEIPIIFVD
jgi:hypothetical protein